MHVVFSGGSTGGHLFPGLAVAEQLRAHLPDVRITFCGNGQPFDRMQVHSAGFPYRGFPSGPLSRSIRGLWEFYRRQQRGARMAGDFLQSQQASLVVGLGGYASAPAARAAGRQKIPLVLLEQNVVPGRATRWLARAADIVCLTYEETRQHLRPDVMVAVTGNPVRKGFKKPQRLADRDHTPRLLILGGSGGAVDMNEHIPRALYRLRDQLAGWNIVHISGPSTAPTERLYSSFDIKVTVRGFVTNMPELLSSSSLVISRAGGTTLSELAASGVPALLIPYPHATDDHQRANASVFVRAGAAEMLDLREFPVRPHLQLADMLSRLLTNDVRRRHMSDAMLSLSQPKASVDIADLLVDLLCGRPQTIAA